MEGLHVAIIMDGNGRWAKAQGLPRLAGHQAGYEALRTIAKACPDAGVRYLTVYAFSTENWERAPEEVSGLMRLFETGLRRELRTCIENNVCMRFIGDRTRINARLVALMQDAEDKTKNNTRLGFQIALSYGGRDEIVRATRHIAQLAADRRLDPDTITPEMFSSFLDTAPWPDPDLLIRTGGEYRISNYLLWQLGYTELFFSEKYWPDFTPEDLGYAVAHFRGRVRRFGCISA